MTHRYGYTRIYIKSYNGVHMVNLEVLDLFSFALTSLSTTRTSKPVRK